MTLNGWARQAAAGRRETKRTNTLWQSVASRKSESDRFGAASDELQPDHSPVRVCNFGHDVLQSRLGSFLATTDQEPCAADMGCYLTA